MPYSSDEGKQMVRDYFASVLDVGSILDVGAGSGTYFNLLSSIFPPPKHIWRAIEIWAPYIKRFSLDEKYQKVIIADVRYVDWNEVGWHDLIIFGDILEHMDAYYATCVLRRAVEHSRYVVVSFPIIHYPQGAEFGNPFEEHVNHFSRESAVALLSEYAILDSFEGTVTGTYIITKRS